ncbi:unnamed protein product [Closterium sp. Yama58-4]|nr:unnamed protein product [Closterium sp. Yama58-4]
MRRAATVTTPWPWLLSPSAPRHLAMCRRCRERRGGGEGASGGDGHTAGGSQPNPSPAGSWPVRSAAGRKSVPLTACTCACVVLTRENMCHSCHSPLPTTPPLLPMWQMAHVHTVWACHSTLLQHVAPGSARLVAFNLGYLPGAHHHTPATATPSPTTAPEGITTQPGSTVAALQGAMAATAVGGVVSVMAYVGHPGGSPSMHTYGILQNIKMQFEMVNYWFGGYDRDDKPFDSHRNSTFIQISGGFWLCRYHLSLFHAIVTWLTWRTLTERLNLWSSSSTTTDQTSPSLFIGWLLRLTEGPTQRPPLFLPWLAFEASSFRLELLNSPLSLRSTLVPSPTPPQLPSSRSPSSLRYGAMVDMRERLASWSVTGSADADSAAPEDHRGTVLYIHLPLRSPLSSFPPQPTHPPSPMENPLLMPSMPSHPPNDIPLLPPIGYGGSVFWTMSDSQRPTLPVPAADVARSSRGIQDAAVLACPSTSAACHSDTGRQGSGGSSSCRAAAAAAGSDKSRASSRAGSMASETSSRSSTRRAHADQRPLTDASGAAPCNAEPKASSPGQQRAELASQIDLGSPQSTNCGGSASTASEGAVAGRDGVTQEAKTNNGASCICRASRRRRKCALPLTSADEVTGTDYCYASHVGFFDAPPSCVCARADSAGGIERAERWERWMDGASLVAHITPFAIVGVCIQFLLDELFGPNVAHVTDDALTVFVDLPANMLGAFLLGLSAVALLPALLARSRHLAIAIVVGLCGSISTFATWNQRMVSIATSGLWARAAFGYFTGSALPLVALVAGVDAGTAIRLASACARSSPNPSLLPYTLPSAKLPAPAPPTDPPHQRRHMLPMLLLSAALLLLAGLGALLLPPTAHHWRMLACACLVAPLGTHLRFLLLRFNGRPFPLRLPFLPCAHSPPSASISALLAEAGEGGAGWEWMPWGTWMANVGAAAVEAAISILYLKSITSEVAVGAMQLGFLACLSTVSMPSLEALYLHYTLRSPAKAYAYALLTIVPSFALGLLIYSLPCWLNGFDSLYVHVGTSPQSSQP